MLLIKRLFKLFIALLILAFISVVAYRLYFWLQSAEPISERAAEETRSNVQWLSDAKPLIYSFSASRTRSIRILSNAIITEQVTYETPVNYAIEYALLDENNDVIETHIYHHASKMTPSDDEYQIKQIIEDRKALNVSSGQSFYISAEQLESVNAISLRLIPEEAKVKGVVVRVHAKTLNDTTDADAAWLKLPLERRERATDYLNIGINGLSPHEISNAVTFRWLKIAPQGIPDVDFRTDTLYETLPYNVSTYDFSQQQLNLGDYYTDNNLCASITITQPDILKFTSSSQQHKPILTWYDKNQIEAPRKVDFDTINPQMEYQTERLNAGLVTICSDSPLLTNFTLMSDLPVLTSQDSYYQIDNTISAEYRVEDNTHLNIELRSLKNNKANVIVLDKNDNEIDSFQLLYSGVLSQFDRVIDEATQRQSVGKVQSFYLRVDKNARKVIIQSSLPAQVRLKSRNSRFHYQRTLCHVNCEKTQHFFDIAAWFEQQANNHYSFSEQDKLIKIRTFAEPADDTTKATFYNSRDLFDKLAISNTALVNTPSRYYQEAKPASIFNYGPVANNALITSSANIKSSTPASVIYQQTNESAKELSLTNANFDQLAHIEDNARLIYQNWQGARPWVKQRLYKLNANTELTLDYPAKNPLSVVFKVFSHNSNQPITLTVTQNARYKYGLTQEYSVANSRYQLLPSKISDAFLVHPKDSELFAYPAVTKKITGDITALNTITVSSNKTIWISVLEERQEQEGKVRWWNENSQ
jgi:hypothetical protein